jgi:sulfate transport system permease protein
MFLLLFLFLPLFSILYQALEKGFELYWKSITDEEALAAIQLTLLVVSVAVPLNLLFGIFASWLITKFSFKGKSLLISLIDLPFSVSPVISGLIFVLLFGTQGIFGTFFADHNIRIIFALPGIIIVTTFVTFPFIARELIPVMEAIGKEEEEAALLLGASGFQTFIRITLPNIKWGLLYGVILCNARAMGDFGAVSVVSGHVRGITNTIPLEVEILFNEYNYTGAFAVASILTLLALVTLGAKILFTGKTKNEY